MVVSTIGDNKWLTDARKVVKTQRVYGHKFFKGE